jgi:hypothetical protein
MKQLCSHSDLWLEEAYFLSSQLSNVDTASYIVIFLKFKKITADYESLIRQSYLSFCEWKESITTAATTDAVTE